MTLAGSGIKRRQLPPSITAAPAEERVKEEEWWKKRGTDEADLGADGWEVISDREQRAAQAIPRVGGISQLTGSNLGTGGTWIPE